MFQRISFFSIFAATLVSYQAYAQQGGATNEVFTPDKAVQAFLGKLLSPNEQEMFAGTEEQFRAKLDQLEEMVGRDDQKLVSELLFFSMQAQTMREAMLSGVLIKQLHISKENLARGLLPYLDVKNDAVREKSHNWLGEVESSPSHKGPDFSHYEMIIREKKAADVPCGLIKHMYAKSPDLALSTMANVYLKKNEAKALMEKAGDKDEDKAVDLLSKRSEWWVHLYVAEKMKQNPKLRSPAVLGRLKKSEHALVKEAVQKIDKK